MPAETPRPSPRCCEERMVAQTCTFLTLAGEMLSIEEDLNCAIARPVLQRQHTKGNSKEKPRQSECRVVGTINSHRKPSPFTRKSVVFQSGSLPDCCFLEAGIVALYPSSDFHRIGVAACTSCQQLQTVDLSQTDVIEILGSTFAHCSQLQQLSLPRKLRIIEQEAFLKCTSLQEVCIPPSLLYIARRAFAGCTQLRAVRKKGQSTTWRGTYAWSNAFDKCEQLDKPQWLRFLPPNANDQWRDDFHDATC